ncbi:MAG: hypothetical protein BAA02_10420 [Paenibacillaceae bacterium ZCTH02-B3]|nr:MAG: hypothetical protein BAA02_10420 [Paenibacillaceae bacterium ZCTH02-B3]
MLMFHLWFLLVVGPVLVYLAVKRLPRDAALFFALSVLSYVLWYGIARDRPFVIIRLIEQGIGGVMALFGAA